ncbi:hypothetical protein WA026_013167 [Henosepilachna vigintioctopunctata]|uniref:Uncharacterized protein n=1 Tax=Henosepilachna vigintioctopunctata TaxID=420089 RepID=A0AAW1UB35_9CUCU
MFDDNRLLSSFRSVVQQRSPEIRRFPPFRADSNGRSDKNYSNENKTSRHYTRPKQEFSEQWKIIIGIKQSLIARMKKYKEVDRLHAV